MKKILFIIILIILLGLVLAVFYLGKNLVPDITRSPSPTVTPTQSPPPAGGPAPTATELIRVFTPSPNMAITNPVLIEGEARSSWFFEASFPVKILDANGKQLGIAPAQALDDWMTTDFVPFQAVISFQNPTTAAGTLVLEKDNPSGLPEFANELRIPIKFSGESASVIKVHFGKKDISEDDCSRTAASQRIIPKTQTIARATVEELLKGSTQFEKDAGFFTSINSEVGINSLTITNGVAKVDFDEQLEAGVAGSCRVTAIRAQIINTLKEFAAVNSVVISINGQTENILQP